MNSALTSALHPQEVAEGVRCVSGSHWLRKHQVFFLPSRTRNLHSAVRCHFYQSEIVQCFLLAKFKNQIILLSQSSLAVSLKKNKKYMYYSF